MAVYFALVGWVSTIALVIVVPVYSLDCGIRGAGWDSLQGSDRTAEAVGKLCGAYGAGA